MTAEEINRLVLLARQCPTQYSPIEYWENINANIELSNALSESGFPFLSRAVLHGKAWARRIARADTIKTIEWSEEEASSPGWSWNIEPNN